MFKQSHIALSWFLIRGTKEKKLREHRTSLCYGSVRPDMKPYLRAKLHEFGITWEDTKELIRTVEAETVTDIHSEREVCIQIGMVMHYIADYFTCPHNPEYEIRFRAHCFYEGRQSMMLRLYLWSSKAKERFRVQKNTAEQFSSADDLIAYIEHMHSLYLSDSAHTPKDDCRWVMDMSVCAALVLLPKVCEDTERSYASAVHGSSGSAVQEGI